MAETWIAVIALGIICVTMRVVGPMALRRRALPESLAARVDAAVPALLGGFVATQTFAANGSLDLDPRAVGVAAAGIALVLRLPLPLVFVVAAATTALLRLA